MGEQDETTGVTGPDADPSPSALRLRALLQGILDPVITIDIVGTIQEVSQSVEGVFGYAPEELVGRNIKLLMPEPHYSAHDDYLAKYRATGETWILGRTREFEVLKKDGTPIIVELSVSRVDVPGQDPNFIGVFRDITDRKAAERALKDNEQRLRAIFDQEFQFVGLLEKDGTVIDVNQAALNAIRCKREDVVGKLFWEAGWWRDDGVRERLRAAVREAARGKFVRFETEQRVDGGIPATFDFSLKPITGDDGEVAFLLPEGRDITRLKQAQRRETSVLRAMATIGESASILAHEIKNPITAVNLALRAVAESLGEDHRTVLEDLSKRMERLEKTMRRTLQFARPLEIEVAPCDLGELTTEVVDTLRPEMEEAGIEVRVEAEDDLRVTADGIRLGEVVTNLVSNAIDAVSPQAGRPEGEGRIHISLKHSCNYLTLTVEDNGPGVPPSLASEIFRPFVSNKEQGTGLGLAICWRIVDEHGGRLEAGDSPLGGAAFRMHLPNNP